MTSKPYAPPAAPLDSTSQPPVKPRRWWAAGLLGLVAVGLGQIYVGKAAKGIAGSCLLLILVMAVGALLIWGPSPGLALALFALPAGLYLYLWVEAMVAARRLATTYRLKRYNRWYAYLAYAVLVQLSTPWVLGLWQENFAQSFYIPAGSMEPTLVIGDHLYVDKRRYRSEDPGRGDLVVFASPEKPNVLLVSRIVGMPGDRLEIRDKELYLDSRRHPEPYAVHQDPITYAPGSPGLGRQRDQASVVVPPETYFLLGDNRDASYDSRFYGPVPRENIRGGGRLVIYWSRNREIGEIRWDRIGRVID